MRRLALTLALLLLFPVAVVAQTAPNGFCGFASAAPISVASLTVSNVAVAPTIPTGRNVIGATVQIETASVHVRDDGGAPDTALGMSFGPGAAGGTYFIVCGTSLRNLQLHRAAATDAVATFTFYGPGR